MSPLKRNFIQLILFGLVFLAVLFAYGYFFLAVKAENQNISRLSNDIALEEKKQTETELIKTNLSHTEDERTKLNSYFVTSDHVVDFLNYLETLGTNSQTAVEITTVNLADSKDAKPAATGASAPAAPANAEQDQTAAAPAPAQPKQQNLSVELKASGTFASVYQFLLLLENVPYDVRIDKVSMKKGVDQTASTGGSPAAIAAAVANGKNLWQGDFIVTLLSFIPAQ